MVDEQTLGKQHHLVVIDGKFNVVYCPVIFSQLLFGRGHLGKKMEEYIVERDFHNPEMQKHQKQMTRKETPTNLNSGGGLVLIRQSDLS